jgi:predicted nucleotidyltransferase
VGSQAYGLAGPESDTDILVVAAAPTVEFHGLRPPTGKAASRVLQNPDITTHEAGKFLGLALSCNPTITELLWLPADGYITTEPLGRELVEIRQRLLSARRVRDAYLGYATQQFKRLCDRGTSFSSDTRNRTEKHARHLLRLVHSGLSLHLTGTLEVRLSDPDRYREFGRIVATDRERGLQLAEAAISTTADAMDSSPSVLSDHADEEAAEQWLRRVRREFLEDK